MPPEPISFYSIEHADGGRVYFAAYSSEAVLGFIDKVEETSTKER